MRGRGPHHAIGLYAHLTWHTQNRDHSLAAGDVPTVAGSSRDAASRTGIRIHALAILTEHVHLVVSYSPRAQLSAFIREAKSESARRVNQIHKKSVLRWCPG